MSNGKLIKNGGDGTKVGNWLRTIGRSDILEKAIDIVGDVVTGDVLGAVKTLLKKDDDISPEQEKEGNRLIELDYADRASARQMYKVENVMADQIAKRVISWNLWVVFLAIAVEIIAVMYIDDKVLIAVISGAIGSFTTALLQERQQVINFFFGSSQGSKDKDRSKG
jgi:hypothetical protein|tara:strand:+ start:230 stop:730 length:501 start_codon:yes stop_codon:yes gene_type:complete